MPIAPPYTWEQSEGEVVVRVDFPGRTTGSRDVLLTSAFLKVNWPPYLFLLDLWGDVGAERSAARWEGTTAVFTLSKVVAEPWEAVRLPPGAPGAQERRRASIDAAYQADAARHAARVELYKAAQKEADVERWETDARKRRLVEGRKAAELGRERAALEAWQRGRGSRERPAGAQGSGSTDALGTSSSVRQGRVPDTVAAPLAEAAPGSEPRRGQDEDGLAGEAGETIAAEEANSCCEGVGEGGGGDTQHAKELLQVGRAAALADEAAAAAEEHEPALVPVMTRRVLPPPRGSRDPVAVQLTPLSGPYQCARGTRDEELRCLNAEEDGEEAGGLSPEQCLKALGHSRFRAGDVPGALSAFSRGLDFLVQLRSRGTTSPAAQQQQQQWQGSQAEEELLSLYGNRAACHLKLRNFRRDAYQTKHVRECIADCEAAATALRARLATPTPPSRPLRDRTNGQHAAESAAAGGPPSQAAADTCARSVSEGEGEGNGRSDGKESEKHRGPLQTALCVVLSRSAAACLQILRGNEPARAAGKGSKEEEGERLSTEQLEALALANLAEVLALQPGDARAAAGHEELVAWLRRDTPLGDLLAEARGCLADGDSLLAYALLTAALARPGCQPGTAGEEEKEEEASQNHRWRALSNRTLCCLRLGRFAAAVRDADAALAALRWREGALSWHGSESEERQGAAAAVAPAEVAGGTEGDPEGRLRWARLLAKRGLAKAHLQRWGEAARDYRASAQLQRSCHQDQEASALEADADRLSALSPAEQ